MAKSKWGFFSIPARSQEGFTLLEVIIALSIMVLAFASILAVESNSINATIRTKQMNTVAMLARNKMVQLEYNVEGKTFEEVKEEESGTFEAPNQDYRWKTQVKEIKFPSLNFGAGGEKTGSSGGPGDQTQFTEMITKMVTEYFTKAVREISVSIYWKRGAEDKTFTISTYWVDLNHEFTPTL